MYICRECGEIFDEPKTIQEQQGYYHGSPAWEEWNVCPCCESTDYKEYTNYDECFYEKTFDRTDCENCPHSYTCEESTEYGNDDYGPYGT